MSIKKFASLILAAVTALAVLPASAGETAAGAAAAYAYVDESAQVHCENMRVFMGDQGLNALTVKGGKAAWLFDVISAKTDNYLYMDIDDGLTDKADKGRVVEITVEYFDSGYACFTIEYTGRDEKSKEAAYLEFKNSLTWKKYTFVISDAVLCNGLNGADFRLCSKTKLMATSPENFAVKSVKVDLTDKFDQLNIGVSSDSYGNNFFTGESIKLKYVIDNKAYAVESQFKGEYTLDATFTAKSIAGKKVFEKKDKITLEPGKEVKYDLDVDVGGIYGVYFMKATFENKEFGIYSEDETRFSYVYTDYGKTMNYTFGTCAGRRPEWAHLLRNAGIGRMRIMNSFGNVSSREDDAKDAFYFGASGYDLQRIMRENGLEIFNTYLSVSSDLLPGEHAPYTEEGLKRYMNYVNYVTDAERYGIETYDMWNEWNLLGASFNRYARPVEDYVTAMKLTYSEMKVKYPDIQFWGNVSSGTDMSFIKGVIANGGLDYMDGFCIHPYNTRYDPMSGTMLGNIWELRKMLDEAGHEDMPIVTSELGYADDTFSWIDEQRQGYYLVEYYVATQKIPHFDAYTMYIFQDSGRTKGNREHHWGLIEFSGAKTVGAAKASYAMVSTLNHMLADCKYKDDITINDDTYAYLMHNEKKNEDVIFLWARGNGGTVCIDLGTDSVELYDAYCNKNVIKGKNGVFTFAASEAPVYIKGNITKFEESDFKIIDKNDFDIEFSGDVDFTVYNPTNEKLNVKIEPINNDMLTFLTEEDESGNVNVHVKTSRTESARDLAHITVSAGDNIYLDGTLVFEYKAPVTVNVTCTPTLDENGIADYEKISLVISVRNDAPIPLEGTFLITNIYGISEEYKNKFENLSIKPGEEYDIVMTLSSDISRIKMDSAFLLNDGISIDFTNTASYAVCYYANEKPAIDGIISDGEYRSKVYLGVDDVVSILAVDPYQGADDFSANLSYTWDDENLYIAMECIDNTLYNKSPQASSMWRYDSLQFAAVYDPEEKYESSEMVSVLYGMAVPYGTEEAKPTLEMVVDKALKKMNDPDSGFEGSINRIGNSTIYEVKVPWQTILTEERDVLPDTILKFTVLANDNDGGGRKALVQYGDGIYGGSKSTEEFIKMYLVK